MAAVCSAASWRSVKKMLNSESFWPKAAPVSELAGVVGVNRGVLVFANDEGFDGAEQAACDRR